MDFEKAYKEIKSLEIEVRSYSDEGYKVRYDFERNLISWRDYYMWNNNFMKSITENKMEILSSRLPSTRFIEAVVELNNGTYKEKDILIRPCKWHITIEFFNMPKMECTGEDRFPKEWIELRSIVENTTECSFRLH